MQRTRRGEMFVRFCIYGKWMDYRVCVIYVELQKAEVDFVII